MPRRPECKLLDANSHHARDTNSLVQTLTLATPDPFALSQLHRASVPPVPRQTASHFSSIARPMWIYLPLSALEGFTVFRVPRHNHTNAPRVL